MDEGAHASAEQILRKTMRDLPIKVGPMDPVRIRLEMNLARLMLVDGRTQLGLARLGEILDAHSALLSERSPLLRQVQHLRAEVPDQFEKKDLLAKAHVDATATLSCKIDWFTVSREQFGFVP